MNSFHNTTALTGEPLRRAKRKASAQEAVVMEFFKEHPYEWFTPMQVHERVLPNNLLDECKTCKHAA